MLQWECLSGGGGELGGERGMGGVGVCRWGELAQQS